MPNEIGLWVCPHCHVLQGIETRIENDHILTNCLSCGVSLPFSEVRFLTEQLVRDAIKLALKIIPNELHDDIRFSWVSNKTVGIIFAESRDELMEYNFDLDTLQEDIEDAFEMNVTLYFED